jgi:uncharacterized protein (DUF952 family)
VSIILHLVEPEAWHAAQEAGEYRAESLDTEQFIHFSEQHQVAGSANRYYKGKNMLLLVVDTDKLKHELRYEASPRTGELFPHLYGALNLDAVLRVLPYSPGEDGTFTEPQIV